MLFTAQEPKPGTPNQSGAKRVKIKNWRSSQSGGCRTIIREDHRV